MKNKKYSIAIILAIIFAIIPLILYFYNFHYGLSPEHSAWSEFGSFYGGVLSPALAVIAFIGLLWNLDVTSNQFRRQSDDSTFFNLINLHNNKVQMTTCSLASKSDVSGFDAFKNYVEEFNRLYDEEAVRIARNEIAYKTKKLTHHAYDFLWQKYSKSFYKENKDDQIYSGEEDKRKKMIKCFECPDKWEMQKYLIGTDDIISIDDRKALICIGHVVLSDALPEERIQSIKQVNEVFYHKFGHMLGHYFRNIHYILDFIDKSYKTTEFSRIFRAQLSRHELTMLYYNSLSNLSSFKLINLLKKYDILNGIYFLDICYCPDFDKMALDIDYILNEKLTKKGSSR